MTETQTFDTRTGRAAQDEAPQNEALQNAAPPSDSAPPQQSSGLSPVSARDIEYPAITLSGVVDYNMYNFFKQSLANLAPEGLAVVEISTLGGDPEVARMMGEDIRFQSELYPSRRLVFLGKTAVYSAGVTFMGFFARCNRYLRRGTRLMIHERLITKTIHLDGPLTTCVANLKAALNEIQASIAIQNEGFANLALGTGVTVDEIKEHATENWYMEANEACSRGLVEQVL